MDKVVSNKIFQSIKSDDLTSFSASIVGNENLSFGRFPVLSLCYLYNAKKIIKKFRKRLFTIDKYNIVAEDFEMYARFRNVAGRTLRLYIKDGSIVSPLEMLAILHKDNVVKNHFQYASKNTSVVENLKSIFCINGQRVEVYTSLIKISKRPLTRYQKRVIKSSAICSTILAFLITAMYIVVGFSTGLGTSWSRFGISSEKQFYQALKSNGSYVLNSDITIKNIQSNISFSGELDGNGYAIYIESLPDESLIKNNTGILKNIRIVCNDIDVEINSSKSLLVAQNNGVIDNISIYCDNFDVNCKKSSNDIYINFFANNNSKTISNCSLKINANIDTVGEGECFVNGFAGENNGTIKNCIFESDSSIITSEADVSGIVYKNAINGKIVGCKNYSSITQSSQSSSWSPNVSGIALINHGLIEKSHNFGALNISANCDEEENLGAVFLGGISALNYRDIVSCLSNGSLSVLSKNMIVYCGGISAYAEEFLDSDKNTIYYPQVLNSGINSSIDVMTEKEKAYAFVGGISGYMYGIVKDTYSLATFGNGFDGTKSFVGTAIGGAYLQYQFITSVIVLEASNVYLLDVDNAIYHIGALINNNSIVSVGVDYPSNGIILDTLERIKGMEVYWNEN